MIGVLIISGAMLPALLLCGYLNRVRGSGEEKYAAIPHKKTLTILVMGLLTALPLGIKAAMSGDFPVWALATGLVLHVVSLQLLLRPSWGELFPHTTDTYAKDFAWGVRVLANRVTGYAYDAEVARDDVKETFWKMSAWIARFGLYGMPFAITTAILAGSAVWAVIWWVFSLWAGWIYLRALTNRQGAEDWIAKAEPGIGILIGGYAWLGALI